MNCKTTNKIHHRKKCGMQQHEKKKGCGCCPIGCECRKQICCNYCTSNSKLIKCFEKNECIPIENNQGICKSSAIQAAIIQTPSQIIDSNQNIIFDIIVHQLSNEIIYDTSTGDFTIITPGDYKLDWQLTVEGSNVTRFINIGVNINNNTYTSFALPLTTGLISGSTIFTTIQQNTVLSLVNNTDDTIRLSRHLPNANLVISNI